MTLNDFELAKGYLKDIEKLEEILVRAENGITLVAQAEDISRFIDIVSAQGTAEGNIQGEIDSIQALFDAL